VSIHLNAPDSDWYRGRLSGAVFAILVALFILLVRLFFLQIIGGEEYRRLSESNCIRLQSIDSPRGLIFDTNGVLIVENRPSFDVRIIPRDAKPENITLSKIAKHLGVDDDDLKKKYKKKKSSPYKPVLLKKDVGRNTLGAIEVNKFDLPGIDIAINPKRHYLFSRSASHVLGYLSEINARELKSGKYKGTRGGDFIGKFGIEKDYENYLRGARGGQQVEVDATGRVVRVLDIVDAIPGKNIFLTIDQSLQLTAESLLDEKVGAVVAINPDNGHVLVMASSPTFDQNDFVTGLSHEKWNSLVNNPYRPMENKAVQAAYPPASTYKIVTAMAGLEEGVVDEETTYHCPGYYKYGNRVYRCWKKGGHGTVNLSRALSESCDVYFYRVGQDLGVDRLAFYATSCGFGKATGINLEDEASGLIPTAAWKKRKLGQSWIGGETLSLAIGQGYNLSTPLQLTAMVAAVANGGTLYRPALVSRIETADGLAIEKNQVVVTGALPVRKETLDLVKKCLWGTVNDVNGTAYGIRMRDVEIVGKTGTAQVISRTQADTGDDDSPRHHKPHAWFVAYAPAVNPKIAVGVIVEHGEHGSSAAAPIARAVIKQYLSSGEK